MDRCFFEMFKVGPLLLQAVPYIREFVQQMTVRMNLPMIVLPMAKITFPSDDAQNERTKA
jgi:hypothetical protein